MKIEGLPKELDPARLTPDESNGLVGVSHSGRIKQVRLPMEPGRDISQS